MKFYKYIFFYLTAILFLCSCSDSDEPFLVVAQGYVLQQNVSSSEGEIQPQFIPYIYFSANRPINTGNVYYGEGQDGIRIYGHTLSWNNTGYETYWEESDGEQNARESLEEVNGIYTCFASESSDELASKKVLLQLGSTFMGKMTERSFNYKAPGTSGNAMITAHVNPVENAQRYGILIMPYIDGAGYTRTQFIQKEFDTAGDLIWQLPESVSSRYPSAYMCITALRTNPDGSPGVLILEGTYHKVTFTQDYEWSSVTD